MAAGGFLLAAQNQKMTDFYQIANPPPVNPPSGSRRLCFVLSKESVVQSTHGSVSSVFESLSSAYLAAADYVLFSARNQSCNRRPASRLKAPLRAAGTLPATRQSRGQGPVLQHMTTRVHVRRSAGLVVWSGTSSGPAGVQESTGRPPDPGRSPLPPTLAQAAVAWARLVSSGAYPTMLSGPHRGFHCRRGQAPLEQSKSTVWPRPSLHRGMEACSKAPLPL